jgi:hypothetical protein
VHIPRLLILALLIPVGVAPLAAHPVQMRVWIPVCTPSETVQRPPLKNYFPRPVPFQQLPKSTLQNGVGLTYIVAPPEFRPPWNTSEVNPFRTQPFWPFPSCRLSYIDAQGRIVNVDNSKPPSQGR